MSEPNSRFAADQEQAQQWLLALRDGTRDQRIEARIALAGIFERRGMLEETIELLERNLEEGAQDPVVRQQLAGLYHRVNRLYAPSVAQDPDGDHAACETPTLSSLTHETPQRLNRVDFADGARGAPHLQGHGPFFRQLAAFPLVLTVVMLLYVFLLLAGRLLAALVGVSAGPAAEGMAFIIAWLGPVVIEGIDAGRSGRRSLAYWLLLPIVGLALVYAWKRAGQLRWVRLDTSPGHIV